MQNILKPHAKPSQNTTSGTNLEIHSLWAPQRTERSINQQNRKLGEEQKQRETQNILRPYSKPSQSTTNGTNSQNHPLWASPKRKENQSTSIFGGVRKSEKLQNRQKPSTKPSQSTTEIPQTYTAQPSARSSSRHLKPGPFDTRTLAVHFPWLWAPLSPI